MRQRNLETTPPQNNTFAEWLRYLVQSSPEDAGELPFLVSLWSACLRAKGKLTELQQEALWPYISEGMLFLEEIAEENNYIEPDMTNVVHIFDRDEKEGA